jgi:glycosyltransferase involved in cell wall biosynthesis
LVTALLAPLAGAPGRTLDVTLFSSSWKDRLTPAPELSGATLVDRRVPVRVLNYAWHRLGWPPAEMLAGGGYDIAHSPHPLLMPARAAAQVITIHDLNFLSHPERTSAEIRRDYAALARAHAHRADAVLVPSAYTASEVERRLGVARDRITVCPAGAPDWAPRTEVPHGGYVLFFGTLEPRKNLSGLLDAYERLLTGAADGGGCIPELVIAGRATEEARLWLSRIDRPPLLGKVRHLGYVAAADRRRLYEGACLLVQPSFDEGFGIPVLEAMSLGVPVVAANRGALPEVLGDAGSLVDPESATDIARAITHVLTDQAFAAQCASRGVARSRLFRWSETATRVYETYQTAIERRRARTPGRT